MVKVRVRVRIRLRIRVRVRVRVEVSARVTTLVSAQPQAGTRAGEGGSYTRGVQARTSCLIERHRLPQRHLGLTWLFLGRQQRAQPLVCAGSERRVRRVLDGAHEALRCRERQAQQLPHLAELEQRGRVSGVFGEVLLQVLDHGLRGVSQDRRLRRAAPRSLQGPAHWRLQ